MDTDQAAEPGAVEISLAGAFRVTRGGRPLSAAELGSRKARTLLKLLAAHRPALVTTGQIADVLWPEDAPADPAQNIATLVSRLRRVLGSEVIRGARGAYQLAGPPAVVIDLDEAARLTGRAERDLQAAPAIALAAAQRALNLLTPGTALADEPDAAWAGPARDELGGLLRRARHAAAAAAVAAGEPSAAAAIAAEAMAADAFDETAHRLHMSANAAAGEPAKALETYAALRGRLAEELGADPAPQTRELHLAILREQGSAPARDRQPRPGAHGTPRARLAGREAEFAALTAVWARAAGGDPGIVLIVGEAGIGKTRLAEEFAAEAQFSGATVLRARCYEAERSLFLQPVVEAVLPAVTRMPAAALGELLGPAAPAFAALIPQAAAILGAVPAERGPVDMERRRAFHAATVFLGELAAASPVLLVLDDLQAAGQSTTEFLHYLARHAARSRLLAVATLRAEHEAETATALSALASRVEVGPLSAAAVTELARQAGQPGQADRILRQTRGHTLFVVEVLRSLASGDAGLPDSLREAVQGRSRRAGPVTEKLLRAAAVLGSAVDPAAVAALLGLPLPAALEHCELACTARLLVPAGSYFEFANDLIRDALYGATPEPVRLAYHRRAADLLTDRPESTAYHAAASGDWARAARAWLAAAEDAFRRFAISDSAGLAGQALTAAERVGDLEMVARARMVRGRAHEAQTAFPAALEDFRNGRSAAQAAGDIRQEMLALRQLGGDTPVNLGVPIRDCEEPLVRGLRLAGLLGDRAAEADLLTRLAVIASHRLRFDVALDYGQRAAVAGRSGPDGSALAAGLDGLKTALGCLGRATELAVVLDELLPLLWRAVDPFVLPWAVFESAYVSVAAGQWDQAAEIMRSAIELNQKMGYPNATAWYFAHLGWLARLRGRTGEAVTLGRRALAISEGREHPWLHPMACALLGTTVLATGDRAGAIVLFESGVTAAERAGADACLLRCLAPLAQATGSPAVLARADRLLAGAGLPAGDAWVLGYEVYVSLARAWTAAGKPGQAREVLGRLLGALPGRAWPAAQAAALLADSQALARLGSEAEARTARERGAGIAREHGLAGVLSEAG